MNASLWTALLCLLLCLSESNGFSSSAVSRNWARRQTTPSNMVRRRTTCLYSSPDNNDDSVFDNYNPTRDEQSEMPDYIASYVDNTMRSTDDETEDETTNTYSHMIGIPMDECHELTLELESVQRAILYHCPLLVHACIVPAVTRMPLLYVSAPPHKNVASVTQKLHQLVERVVQEQLYVKQAPTPVMDPENEDEIMGGINRDGYKPLLVSFENLEIDGAGNQVLSTVGIQDQGSERLVSLVNTLKQEIQALGWKVMFPPDDHASDENKFRPRIPFMRLPDNFVQLLDPLEEGQEDWMRTSDQGGNGISPIFWCQWWEDTMARNVRLREVSVYPRQPTSPQDSLGEQAFYIPHETTLLPTGNDALTKAEARHEQYNKERMVEAEGRIMDEDENGMRNDDATLLDPQVKRQRERARIYLCGE